MTPADFTGPSVRAPVQDSVWDSVCRSVDGSVRRFVLGSAGNPAWDSVERSVQDPVWGTLWSQLREPL